MVMGWAYEQKGMFQEALSALPKAFNCTLKTASIAHVFASLGNRGAAEKILEELLAASKTKYVSPYDIAVVYAGLDDKTRTFEWLNKAYDEHAALMVYMNSDPRLQPLRSEPPFQDLLRRMGLRNRRATPTRPTKTPGRALVLQGRGGGGGGGAARARPPSPPSPGVCHPQDKSLQKKKGNGGGGGGRFVVNN